MLQYFEIGVFTQPLCCGENAAIFTWGKAEFKV